MAPWAGPHLQSQQPRTVEDMYKMVSRIVLALKSPSGLTVEIRGKGQQRQEVGDGGVSRKWGLPLTGEMRTWKKSPQCSSCSLPFLWKGWGRGSQCEVPRRLLLSRDFHILIWGWLSSMGRGPPRLQGCTRHGLGGFSPPSSFVGIETRRPDIPKAMEKSRVWKT